MLSLVFSWVFLCQILHVCRIVDIKDNFKFKSKSWSVQIIQIIFSVEDVGDYLPLNSAVVDNQDFPEKKTTIIQSFDHFGLVAHREVLEEEIAPVVLDVEEEAKHEHHVHEADEDDDHHPRVNRHPDPPFRHLLL